MTRDEAKTLLALPHDQAIRAILVLAEKAEKYDQIVGGVSPTTPSGMTPISNPYQPCIESRILPRTSEIFSTSRAISMIARCFLYRSGPICSLISGSST